jgi:ubiquinone/menaquinone biosynthesis C-methylase UbiE
MSVDVSAFKDGQRRMWTAGDYPELSRSIASVGALVAERATAGAGAGVELLDVATGSGNVALPAAAAGAKVTGLDLTPKLLEVARRRAAKAGLEIDFIEGDAEALPFAADSFERVTSCFGVIFAPRHQLAADELTRVARPGSSIVLTAWTPEGLNGRMFTTIASYLPPPPPELQPSVLWAVEDHVSSLFAASRAELTFERHVVTFEHDSPESWFEYYERTLGPTILAKAALEPQGKWEPLREELLAIYADGNEATDGSFRAGAEYLLTVARMPG